MSILKWRFHNRVADLATSLRKRLRFRLGRALSSEDQVDWKRASGAFPAEGGAAEKLRVAGRLP
jgi:hypothetical protein